LGLREKEMTAILAVVDRREKKQYLVSDCRTTYGDIFSCSSIPKTNDIETPFGWALIGAAGDAAACNAVVHLAKVPKKTKKHKSLQEYMLKDLPAVWQQAIKDSDLKPEELDYELIVAINGGIWYYTNLSNGDQVQGDAWGIGSGGLIALAHYRGLCVSEPELDCASLAEESVEFTSTLVASVGNVTRTVGRSYDSM